MATGKVFELLKSFSRDERGATALEYGLMLAIFSLVVTTALATVGTNLANMFQRIVDIFAA
ncbi:MAG: Flp family type IVb pilin [Parvibaculum sp.]|uniref:Flp family type IVb pilin n=1 Tax=Parvibaculum sp. TaxID=2024848 RepID=UPI0025F6B175|nr:Flp family type IVb pilin [Parvibaculum sp.]MCE9651351.1 Flp family type IVb pilin [Parvibaculum sp.]